MVDLHSSFPSPFPPTSYERWREDAEAGLKGAPFDRALITPTHEGISLAPLYTREDSPAPDAAGFPGFAPFTRGCALPGPAPEGWEIHQPINHPDLKEAQAQLRAHLERGVQSLWLQLGDSFALASTAAAWPQNGVECTTLPHLRGLARALKDAGAPVSVETGANPLAGLALLVSTPDAQPLEGGALNTDPLGTLATTGSLPGSLKEVYNQLACVTSWADKRGAPLRTVTVSTTPYHRAGATAVQELAYGISTGVTYLRELTDRGLELDALLPRISFRFSIGRSFFMELAKLRAARMLWSKVTQACGVSGGMHIHGETSSFTQTKRDPFVNLLRGTSATFAAAAGGANQISTTPFDAALGLSDDFGHRLAAHTQVVLAEEAHLGAVIDPGGGSWYIESLTNSLAEQAWQLFTELEGEGGITAALESGEIHQALQQAWDQKRDAVEHRRDAITGVSEFPHLGEEPLSRPPSAAPAAPPAKVDDARLSPSRVAPLRDAIDQCSPEAVPLLLGCLGEAASLDAVFQALWANTGAVHIEPIPTRRLAEPFEELRDQSDRHLIHTGARPTAFLANLGPTAEHKARSTFAQSFLAAGGIEGINTGGYNTEKDLGAAFLASGATIAVLCSSDQRYATHAEAAARALRAAGAGTIVLAGRPSKNPEGFTTAGVDHFIFRGCNATKILRDLLTSKGAQG